MKNAEKFELGTLDLSEAPFQKGDVIFHVCGGKKGYVLQKVEVIRVMIAIDHTEGKCGFFKKDWKGEPYQWKYNLRLIETVHVSSNVRGSLAIDENEDRHENLFKTQEEAMNHIERS